MTLAEVLLTLALAIVGGYAAIASYAYRRDIATLKESDEKTREIAEANREKLQELEVKMATSEERHDSHDQTLVAHEASDEKAFDRVDKKLDGIERDLKELVRYARTNSTPPRGFPRVGG